MDLSKTSSSRIEDREFFALKEFLGRKGKMRFPVVSGSMEPVIMTGEVIEVVPIASRLNAFDIIVFHQEGQLVCHMVVKSQSSLSDQQVLTSGYRYQYFDLPVKKDKVLGYVTSHRISFWRRVKFTWRFLRKI